MTSAAFEERLRHALRDEAAAGVVPSPAAWARIRDRATEPRRGQRVLLAAATTITIALAVFAASRLTSNTEPATDLAVAGPAAAAITDVPGDATPEWLDVTAASLDATADGFLVSWTLAGPPPANTRIAMEWGVTLLADGAEVDVVVRLSGSEWNATARRAGDRATPLPAPSVAGGRIQVEVPRALLRDLGRTVTWRVYTNGSAQP